MARKSFYALLYIDYSLQTEDFKFNSSLRKISCYDEYIPPTHIYRNSVPLFVDNSTTTL